MSAPAVILDTNVFVAAGFRQRSASAWIVEQIRSGPIRMIWSPQTRGETKHIVDRIPPLSWTAIAELFRQENCHAGPLSVTNFDFISDRDDWKFAALAEATGAILLTNDQHLLQHHDRAGLVILTPRNFRERGKS